MRFVPLVCAHQDAALWRNNRAVELEWREAPLAPWIGAKRAGLEVHALHIPDPAWAASPARLPLAACLDLEVDFLVLAAPTLEDRATTSAFLGALESLLEVVQGRGLRLVVQPTLGAESHLATLLREIRADAVAFAWRPPLDLSPFADRLACAVAPPDAELNPLAALGYRWNVAVPHQDPHRWPEVRETLERTWGESPRPNLHQPAPDDVTLSWGPAWEEP